VTDPIIGLPTRNAHGQSHEYALGRAYCDAIAQAGGVPLPIPLLEEERLLRRLYQLLDGLLLCGGGDVAAEFYAAADSGRLRFVDRPRDRVEMALTRWALEGGLPLLGICRGIQTLNVAAGGTLIQDIPSEVPGALLHASERDLPLDHLAHQVMLEPESLLAEVLAPASGADERPCVKVNSRHHQAVKAVAPGFMVSARSPDGIIEAIESVAGPTNFALGVQWHPENLVPEHAPMRRLFRRFVDACRR